MLTGTGDSTGKEEPPRLVSVFLDAIPIQSILKLILVEILLFFRRRASVTEQGR